MSVYSGTDERPTLRIFSPPKEPAPAKRHENGLHERIRELEEECSDLTVQLSERTEELLEALSYAESLEDTVIKGAP